MGTRSIVSPKIALNFSANIRNTLTDATYAQLTQPNLNYTQTITDGIGASQADRGWQSVGRTLQNGASEVIDLFDFAGTDIGAGAGLDALGQTLNIQKLVGIAIVNNNAITSNAVLHVEPDPTAGFTALGSHNSANGGGLAPQGLIFKCQPHGNGLDITDGSNHRLRMTAVEGSLTYSIYLLGRSDDEESSSSSLSSSSLSSISTSSSSQSMSESSISTSSNSSSSSISTSSNSSSSSLSSLSSSSQS